MTRAFRQRQMAVSLSKSGENLFSGRVMISKGTMS